MPRPLWLAWEDDSSIRSRVLSGALDADFRAIVHFDNHRWLKPLRYPAAVIATLFMVLIRRPSVVVVQNPSILLAFEAALLRPILGYRLAIDLHTPFAMRTGIARWLAEALHIFGLKHCDAVIVTNAAFQCRVEQQTSKQVLVLPDRIPILTPIEERKRLRGVFNVLFICTFSDDEPWQEVVEAANLLSKGTVIYISGRCRHPIPMLPSNAVLTGFLPTEDYHALLQSVDAVMVLTSAEQNLVCGGYEAVAAEKPMILSDTAALRTYFRRGVAFTRNTRSEIARAIEDVAASRESMSAQVSVLKTELNDEWNSQWRLVHSAVAGEGPLALPQVDV